MALTVQGPNVLSTNNATYTMPTSATTLNQGAAGGLLAGVSSPNAGAVLAAGAVVVSPSAGNVTVSADGSFVFTASPSTWFGAGAGLM